MISNLKMNLAAKLELDEETKQKIENFSNALKELPKELNIMITMNGAESNNSLKVNLGDLLIDQVKEYFKKDIVTTIINNTVDTKCDIEKFVNAIKKFNFKGER